MDIVLCSAVSKDRSAAKCMIGFAVFFGIATVILYFSLRTTDDVDLCLAPRLITDFTAQTWRHSPRLVKPCNSSDTDTDVEISFLEFYFVEVTGVCQIDCTGRNEFQATCPFYIQGLKFVINGTNSTICGRVNLHLKWELSNDDVDAKVIAIGNDEDIFKTHPECIKGQKTPVENENSTLIQLSQFNSILSRIYLLGVNKFLGTSDSQVVPANATEYGQVSTVQQNKSSFPGPEYCDANL